MASPASPAVCPAWVSAHFNNFSAEAFCTPLAHPRGSQPSLGGSLHAGDPPYIHTSPSPSCWGGPARNSAYMLLWDLKLILLQYIQAPCLQPKSGCFHLLHSLKQDCNPEPTQMPLCLLTWAPITECLTVLQLQPPTSACPPNLAQPGLKYAHPDPQLVCYSSHDCCSLTQAPLVCLLSAAELFQHSPFSALSSILEKQIKFFLEIAVAQAPVHRLRNPSTTLTLKSTKSLRVNKTTRSPVKKELTFISTQSTGCQCHHH